MKNIFKIFYQTTILIVLIFNQTNISQVRLPKLISDGMILQRDVPVKIWGWASEGEKVTINFCGKVKSTITGSNGKWIVTLPKLKAGGPYEMEINGSNHVILKDILIGEVWVCSGQSNMELMMERVADKYKDEITNSTNTYIRQFVVPLSYNFGTPQEDVSNGKWESANPETVLNFSAVGYFFAKELFKKFNVPIGLVKNAVGGSPAEAWLSEEDLKEFPNYLEVLSKLKSTDYIEQIRNSEKKINDDWYELLNKNDLGYSGVKKWNDTTYSASSWSTMNIPCFWDEGGLEKVNGVVWFRKEINIPKSMAGKPSKLELGRIVDSDSTFINGKFVGNVTYQYPPRKYDVPAGLLKEGENIIVVRVVNSSGRGGFIKDKPYYLSVDDQVIDLKGEWSYKLGATALPLPGSTFFHYKPAGLFNGMISPLLNYSIKGVVWYQGESNTNRAKEYQKLFPAVINNWRNEWKLGNFPFLYVQLANFLEAVEQPDDSQWAELREAQLKTLSLRNTGMATIIDIGEWNDIHPLNKKDVGYRLALSAFKIAYGDKKIVSSGPLYKSMKIEKNKVILSFTSVGGGLVSKDGADLKYFAIAGADKKFVWAKAIIKNNKVIVWNEEIKNPVAVRYAWADNPEGANLYNKEGLPASSFRTDDN